MSVTCDEVPEYQRRGRPGKMQIVPSKPLESQRDLSLASTPGVAEPVLAIEREPLDAYEYTARGNLVVAISNSTAILHLGNRNALAGHGWPDAARSG